MFQPRDEAVGGKAELDDRKVAKFIKQLPEFQGNAALYEMSPPYLSHRWVIASAVNNIWARETYLFPAVESGEVADWLELEGSQKHTTSHLKVFTDIGYEVLK